MRVIDVRPTDVEVTVVFTLSEAKDIKSVLDSCLIARNMEEHEEELESYDKLYALLESIVKTEEQESWYNE